LTNNFALKPELIADFCRQRWQVELFFKWIKQHLRIKTFFGTTENAVKAQIWIAVCTCVLIAIAKKRLHLTCPHFPYQSKFQKSEVCKIN
jgi:IS4 transposase